MSEVPKNTPDGLLARAEWLLNLGYDIAAVMNDEDWSVRLLDGYPEVMLTANGLRVMARFAPRPLGPEVAEEIIAAGRAAGGQS